MNDQLRNQALTHLARFLVIVEDTQPAYVGPPSETRLNIRDAVEEILFQLGAEIADLDDVNERDGQWECGECYTIWDAATIYCPNEKGADA